MLKAGSRILIVAGGLMLFAVLYVPLWRIELNAPQYPEGLELIINPDGLGGNVDIINGLNHYIGMKTLHNEDFVEFRILPILIIIFGTAFLLTGFFGRLKLLKILTVAFILFGVIAMADFWKWEYNYGHDLNPDAAIKVPGMAYQPPLIGYKQLLNFAAYSIPATGGWLFIAAGVILVLTLLVETRSVKMKTANLTLLMLPLFLISCSRGPGSIKYGTDQCDNCKMTISDTRFGVLLHTEKGRDYKFDDIRCLKQFVEKNTDKKGSVFLADFCAPNLLQPAAKMQLLKSESFQSPMGGNTASFSSPDSLEIYMKKTGAEKISLDLQ